jgi:hypothetical protein
MKKIAVSVLFLILILVTTGCQSGLSECDAVKIAREQLPANYANAGALTFFDQYSGVNGTWKVIFPLVNVPFDELGWAGEPGQYYKSFDPSQEMPEGVYANVVIYVDAATGEVTRRELNNAFYSIPVGAESKCDC